MIEYAATFFGLAYLLCFLRWTLRPTQPLFLLTLGLGTLGCLTKATSFVIPAVTAVIVVGLRFLECVRPQPPFNDPSLNIMNAGSGSQESFQGKRCLLHILALTVLVLVPLTVGYLYIAYGDAIKEQGAFTAWLSSKHPYTRNWTYGSWAQRCNIRNWNWLWNGAKRSVVPSLSLAMVIGFCALPFRVRLFRRFPIGNFWVGCSVALGPLLAVAVFYNLYVIHTYYLIACAPLLALFAGLGLSLLFQLARTKFLRVVFLLLLIGLGLQEWSGRLGALLGAPAPVDTRVSFLSEAAHFIGKDEPVIIVSSAEWSGFAPYYLKRRAFMAMLVNKPVNIQPLLERGYFKKNGFHWLLIEGSQPRMQEMAAQIKNQWKSARAMPLSADHNPYQLYALLDD